MSNAFAIEASNDSDLKSVFFFEHLCKFLVENPTIHCLDSIKRFYNHLTYKVKIHRIYDVINQGDISFVRKTTNNIFKWKHLAF